MRKFLSLFLVLFTLTFTFTLTCSAETLSDEILAQGKAEADLFLTLKQALGLDWIDEYNAYLSDPIANPAPAWDTSVASLVSQGYLSSSFPTDFTIALTGQEVTISRTVSQAALREAMAIYLPTMTVSGDVVSLLVQRPAQWIAYETALNGKVDKDGSDNPDILPNSSLDFGSNSQINFVSNDGKILGVNSLFYKTQELDDRFVNITGDTMTGILTAAGFKVGSNNVWHQGNDGSGSGLDADLLDGQHGAFYQNASNLNAGTVPTERLTGTYNIDISGNAATASKLATARTISLAGNASGSASFDGSNNVTINTTVSHAATANHANDADYADDADKLDGLSSEKFLASRGNRLPPSKGRVWTVGEFLSLAPGTYMVDQNISATEFGLPVDDKLFNLIIFPPNGAERGTAMILFRNGPVYIFNKHSGYPSDPMSPSYWKQVWHSGSDGIGSGLDADLLDGQDSAFYRNASNINAGTLNSARLSGTYGISITGNAATATTASNSDKLDGYHHDAFVKRAGDTATGPIYFQGGLSAEAQTRDIITTRTPSGFWQTNSATTGEGWPQTTNSWYHLLSSTHSNTGNYYSMQFAGNFYNSSDIYYRSTNGSGTTPWNKMWHSGNDGLNSGLDADLLDGQHGAFYQNASNLSTGVVPVARLSGTYNISITGNAATATNANHANNADYATNAGNADTLDGKHESAFAPASHNHGQYVLKAGDTMTGALTAPEYRINDANTKLLEGANNSVCVQTNYGYTEIGPQNASYAHFTTDRPEFYFNKPVEAATRLQVYATNTYLTGTEGKIANNKIWHQGNDSSGSGLDADMVDGKHASDFISIPETTAVQTWVSQGTGWRLVTEKYFNGFVRITGWRNGTVEGADRYTTRTFTLPVTITKFISTEITTVKQFISSGWYATNTSKSTSSDYTFQTYRVVVGSTTIVTYAFNTPDPGAARPEELFFEVFAFAAP